MIKAFWILYSLLLFAGAIAFLSSAVKYAALYKNGKEHFDEHIKKQTDKGLNRTDAYMYVKSQLTNAILRCFASGSITLCMVYAIVDIFYTKF